MMWVFVYMHKETFDLKQSQPQMPLNKARWVDTLECFLNIHQKPFISEVQKAIHNHDKYYNHLSNTLFI